MVIDCSLSALKVPGFSGVNPPFGTKKPDGQDVTAREADINVRLPFARQRPYHVGEDSVTSVIEAHSAFVLEAAGVTLTLGEGGFIGCTTQIINVSEDNVFVSFGSLSEETVALISGEVRELIWHGSAWRLVEKSGAGGDSPYGYGTAREGRNILEVLRVETVAEAMSVIQANLNNGASAANGEPDFSGLQIGDYIDGINLVSGAVNILWNETYKNTRIVVSGFNTYKSAGDTENAKNHILFTFRHCPLTRQMNTSDTNTGGFNASALKTYLESDFKAALNAALGVSVYSVRRGTSKKGSSEWSSFGVFWPTEIEVFGVQVYGDECDYWGTQIQMPIFAQSYEYRIKRYNGARQWWFLATPYKPNTSSFCYVNDSGNSDNSFASGTGGVAPDSVSHAMCRSFDLRHGRHRRR
ncbi:MAG: DUF6273 domain-containing protein [Spirochaetaceae bacterium]|jgi:hypothetical protein|nr:DUF6273 domain-containing protein [Spirochaetaceae bacterium]